VIDTNALLTLLDKSHIAHAVLNAFEQEPLPVVRVIWQDPTITVLAHISGPTNIDSAAEIVAENLIPDSINSELRLLIVYIETVIAKPVPRQTVLSHNPILIKR